MTYLTARDRIYHEEGCAAARNLHNSGDCPYPSTELYQRCLWLAGYWDTYHQLRAQEKIREKASSV